MTDFEDSIAQFEFIYHENHVSFCFSLCCVLRARVRVCVCLCMRGGGEGEGAALVAESSGSEHSLDSGSEYDVIRDDVEVKSVNRMIAGKCFLVVSVTLIAVREI